MDWGANAEAFLAVTVMGFAALLAGVSAISWNRLRNRRALLIGLGFLAFAGKGAYLTFAAFQSRGSELWILVVSGFDVLILLMLYIAIRNP